MEDIFTKIYKKNGWHGIESRSGKGSGDKQTETIRDVLPTVLNKYGVVTMLDIPCGDFYWMSKIDLTAINYIGGDIVKDLIINNSKTYNRSNVHFEHLNLISDVLPCVDLIFCRDCLVHLSYEDIFKAIDNIRKSGSKYLLVTTFPERKNYNITTGEWRPLNLQDEPFSFKEPIELINEQCSEKNGKDKSLGLWLIKEL